MDSDPVVLLLANGANNSGFLFFWAECFKPPQVQIIMKNRVHIDITLMVGQSKWNEIIDRDTPRPTSVDLLGHQWLRYLVLFGLTVFLLFWSLLVSMTIEMHLEHIFRRNFLTYFFKEMKILKVEFLAFGLIFGQTDSLPTELPLWNNLHRFALHMHYWTKKSFHFRPHSTLKVVLGRKTSESIVSTCRLHAETHLLKNRANLIREEL